MSKASSNAYKIEAKESLKKRRFSQDYYDVLATFNNIAAHYPILDKASERKMIEKYKKDRSQLNRLLFCHNIRIVLNLARKYVQKVESPADLLMNGAQGLMIATERFDINKGTKFNTYATVWVFKYIQMLFYSRSPITGVNQLSLNALLYDAEHGIEPIDYLCENARDISTALSGRNSIGPMYAVDYSFIEKTASNSPSREVEDISNSLLIHDVIDEISSDPHYEKIDKDIIYNNMMSNNQSINALAMKYNVPSKEINKRKRKLISDFKTVLSDKYNINSLSDIIEG